MSIKIETYTLDTCMGKSSRGLGFLTTKENMELNIIGYENSKNREEYLNSLGLGTIKVIQTKRDSGDFCESFMIIRAYIQEK